LAKLEGMGSPLVLGFWKDVAGLAQAVRLFLEYSGSDYVDKNYVFTMDMADWLTEKFKLGLDFPNLPYLIDGDIKLTRQDVILKYLGRKHNLIGQGASEQALVDQLMAETLDLHKEFRSHVYKPDFQSCELDLKMTMTWKVKEFEAFLGDKQFLLGSLTVADFGMYEVLRVLRAWKKDIFNDLPKLVAYIERFEDLPTIKAYLESPRFINAPFFGFHCKAKFDYTL